MSHVFHRHVRTDPPIAVAGDGPYIVDAEGKRYLDASGGAAVSSLGHSDAEVVQAIKEQVDRIAYAHTAFFSNRPMEALAEALIAKAPGDLSRVFFVSGGSEAVEAALKLARQYFVEVDQPDRRHFIARRQSYHGSTLGALAVGGNRARRQPFTPVLLETHYVSPCYAYRYKRDDESDEEYAARLGDELEAAILELGPESVLAFVAETVVGASAGAVPPVPGYFARVREICDRFGVLMILDEVMCGMGRTGSLYACEQEGVAPDLLVVAKGVGAGYQPIGAVLVSERIYQAFRDGSGSFLHGHTYMGHATACAAGLAVQRKLQAPGMMERINSLGDGLHGRLEARFGNHHHVGDIRGRGLFRAIELVQDRGSKAPFAPELGLDVRIKAEAMARGLICYPGAGTADGERGNHVLVAPPFIVGAEELDRIVELLGDAVDAAVAAVQ
ncbi:MAG: aspartate aminotransferase family protein [Alphaproteobacteria bacterium]